MANDENPVEWGLGRPEELQKPVLLTTAADEMEAGVITSLLGSAGIASRCRNKGMGSYMGIVMGSNRFGIEIDVAEKDLELAKSLLQADPMTDDEARQLLETQAVETAGEEPVEREPEEGDPVEVRESDLQVAPEDVIPEGDFFGEVEGEEDTAECDAPDVPEPSDRTPVSPMFWGLLLVALLVVALVLRLLGFF
jgi:hypothetical protein